ncbi:hypothetical protein [Oleiagrimonas sp. C23AA]|uniref:hypothetical protein n=1 Tax=Oleiagrimonas sp. C23AA TaxID=2719047 RepID=UPI00141DA8B8|nr:hypothetical protein [Oleiagrimonas sp. C23AA]NII11315.1 hypothetical protein [Oleiagrimonas sp. C23AA]
MRQLLFRVIGILQIAGGLFGLAAMIQRLYPWGMRADVIIAILGALAFGFILVSGVLLIEGRESGVRLSRWAQLLQLPLIATPWFSYSLHAGAFANVLVLVHKPLGLVYSFGLADYHWLAAIAGPSTPRIGINVVALIAWLVLRLRR